MPKQKIKTHSGAKKRCNLTKKTTKRKRGLRKGVYADVTNAPTIRKMIPYK